MRLGNTVSQHRRRQYKDAGPEHLREQTSLAPKVRGVTTLDHTQKLSSCLIPKSRFYPNSPPVWMAREYLGNDVQTRGILSTLIWDTLLVWVDKMVVRFTKAQFFSYGVKKKIKLGHGIYYWTIQFPLCHILPVSFWKRNGKTPIQSELLPSSRKQAGTHTPYI